MRQNGVCDWSDGGGILHGSAELVVQLLLPYSPHGSLRSITGPPPYRPCKYSHTSLTAPLHMHTTFNDENKRKKKLKNKGEQQWYFLCTCSCQGRDSNIIVFNPSTAGTGYHPIRLDVCCPTRLELKGLCCIRQAPISILSATGA